MNTNLFPNLWRFVLLVAVQVLLLKQVSVTAGAYFNVLLYPLFVLLLPVQLFVPYVVLLGFAVGMTVDYFYVSFGLHASAAAFSGFARSIIFKMVEPKGGFSGKEPVFTPFYFGWPAFTKVAGLFFFTHIFWYFSVDYFTFYYFSDIAWKTLASWVLTMIFVIFFGFLFNPKR